jgi:hypothetical protein
MTPEQIARVVDTVAELRADNERLRGVIRRNCDPFSATPPDAEIINEVCALEAKP